MVDHFMQQPHYHIAGNSLPSVTQASDLGVIIDSNLKFSSHIQSIVKKGCQRMNLLLRCFNRKNVSNLVKGYTVYVRPALEYCSQIWSPYRVKDIKAIEAVQRKFTKRLPGLEHLPYCERLSSLGLESLAVRRYKLDLMTTYKILFSQTCLNAADFYEFHEQLPTRGHRYRLRTDTARTDTRKHSFINRTVSMWNALPDTVEFCDVSSFKNSLNLLNFDNILESELGLNFLFN